MILADKTNPFRPPDWRYQKASGFIEQAWRDCPDDDPWVSQLFSVIRFDKRGHTEPDRKRLPDGIEVGPACPPIPLHRTTRNPIMCRGTAADA